MYPTLTGDCELALVDTHYKGGVGIRVGDVVRFWHPHRLDQALAKRVKGLEGHTYTKNLQGLGTERVVVQKGYCKVVGDNESDSDDSRNFGSVPLANIEGKVTWRWGQEGSWKIRNNDATQKGELGRLSSLSKAVVKRARRLVVGILPATRTQALVPKAPRNVPVISSTKPTRLNPSALNKTHTVSSTRSKGLVPNMLRNAKVVSSIQPGALSPKARKNQSVILAAKSKADI
ncbi:hypothetical protein N7G274_008667 [Stereocaulon virgatum]|uniref:Peptidase S26 domain-containing protein n=1 Tax=Stereocaulon virgatum TaxID=373712 RepID=A0ABR3ZZF9_9LECA